MTPSPPDAPLSHPVGRDIVREAVAQADARLNGRLTAAFAIGSLAHGGFVPDVSDVDLALIVDQADQALAPAIDAVRRDTVQRYRGSAHYALAERLSIFWSDWEHLAHGTEAGRFPATDRLDLLDSGVLLHGTDQRARCARPSTEDLLLDSATFALAKFGDPAYLRMLGDSAALAGQGARAITKAVLFPVRLLYTATTGRLGRNDDAARWYTATPNISRTLVTCAARWRANGIDDPAAAGLLQRELLPLYQHCADQLSRKTAASGHPGLATRLARLHAALTPDNETRNA
ncbi:hypothetical protein SAMN04489713_1362 [Actinomadura madurae]|uniref:Nucleotidyltransferase domain-containing protein n=1 Tax=Actinomadura madurae TaxID=1993 RepID=A0A1I5YQ95_9ACTN|nr:hypothetical protein [Actinomadura madurae]SFQ46376.1 hypothetical protein SAMN04489713_1362 [Actinomadura madurae]